MADDIPAIPLAAPSTGDGPTCPNCGTARPDYQQEGDGFAPLACSGCGPSTGDGERGLRYEGVEEPMPVDPDALVAHVLHVARTLGWPPASDGGEFERLLDIGMDEIDADCYVARDHVSGRPEKFDLRDTFADALRAVLRAMPAAPASDGDGELERLAAELDGLAESVRSPLDPDDWQDFAAQFEDLATRVRSVRVAAPASDGEGLRELLSDAALDRILTDLVVAAGGERGFTSDRCQLARWDLKAALSKELSRVRELPAGETGTVIYRGVARYEDADGESYTVITDGNWHRPDFAEEELRQHDGAAVETWIERAVWERVPAGESAEPGEAHSESMKRGLALQAEFISSVRSALGAREAEFTDREIWQEGLRLGPIEPADLASRLRQWPPLPGEGARS